MDACANSIELDHSDAQGAIIYILRSVYSVFKDPTLIINRSILFIYLHFSSRGLAKYSSILHLKLVNCKCTGKNHAKTLMI